VVGGAGDRHAGAGDVLDPARQVGTRRHQKGRVVQPRLARIVGLGVGPMIELHQHDVADAELCRVGTARELGEPEEIAIVARNPVEIAHVQRHRTDVQRRAAGKGGNCRGILRVHAVLYRPSGPSAQRSVPRPGSRMRAAG
jgi:hypothetical protein